MKKGLFAVCLVLCLVVPGPLRGQTIEMAGTCEDLQKQLVELVKKPGSTDAEKIKQAIGLDILNSCSTKQGQVVCFQCMDKNRNLRTLQLLQKSGAKQFELLGFGCQCADGK